MIKSYQVSLKVLAAFISSSSSLESRQLRLSSAETNRTRSLAVDAASCALAFGHVELAVEMLEQGRSILLTQAGRYRTRVDHLERGHPALAKKFRRISQKMENAAMSEFGHPLTSHTSVAGVEDPIASYQQLSQDWLQVVDQIRSLPDFESFLQPIPFSILRKVADEGPVIVVNHSETRTDAIIIHSHGDPFLVRLLDVNPRVIRGMVKSARHQNSEPEFRSLLHLIWKVIVQPIVHILQTKLRLQKGSRIRWCPTGSTSHIPLHAAGDYTKAGESLMDLFVSSYIPTLSALLRARQGRPIVGETASKILLVGQPETPGQSPLPSVASEIQKIEALTRDITVLKASTGTRDSVLSAMSQHPWIHLSCHGHVDQNKPFRSSFALYDGPLTLLDIARQDLPQADLAFLSACHSAASNLERPDDVLHLAAGVQFAGFRTVVGTLWAMSDDDGPHIAEIFYSSLMGIDGTEVAKSSAHALHRAVQRLRRRRVSSSRWSCFVHYGC